MCGDGRCIAIDLSKVPLSLHFTLWFCFSFLWLCWHLGSGHRAQCPSSISLFSSSSEISLVISNTYLQYFLGPLPKPAPFLRLPAESEDKHKESQLWARLRLQDSCSLAPSERALILLRWLCALDIPLYKLTKL